MPGRLWLPGVTDMADRERRARELIQEFDMIITPERAKLLNMLNQRWGDYRTATEGTAEGIARDIPEGLRFSE
ncbi:hypothetical protein GCM10012289_26190 [Nonomuraea cavernae]|uniref:Uncharacterized protein n=1 Tax=Nonomuraea cavernae TaxID=2045107 RepID=A0A917YYT4_9ACTN|nr:hypothetical protein GCM10012289_26190 [Nonomuraea cavernae]